MAVKERGVEERLALVEAAILSIQALVTRYDENLSKLSESFQRTRQYSWPTILTVVTVILAVISVGETQLSTLDDRADRNRIQTQANMVSIAANKADTDARMIEIETQFCASDIVRNLIHANDLRITSMLVKKSFNMTFPTDNAFYPEICQRHPSNPN